MTEALPPATPPGTHPAAEPKETAPWRPSPVGAGAYIVDGGRLQCARLLILLQRHVRVLASGTLVHVRTHDPVAGIDLPAWCHMTGHLWLGAVPDDTATATYAIQVSAAAVPTHPQRPWRLQPQAAQPPGPPPEPIA